MARSSPASTSHSEPAAASSGAAAKPLAGRHALVTGGSRGIGAAVAAELIRLGAKVTLCARGERALLETVDRLQHDADGIQGIAGDVTQPGALPQLIERASATFGAPAILVNNAGGAESAAFSKTESALWRRMIELNLTSVYEVTRACAPAMLKAGWGRIVNVASTAGLKGYPYVSAYVAAKHGVIGLTRALALEFATAGVTVNAVCPGYTDTPMLDAAVATISAKTKRPAEAARAQLAAANPMGRLIAPDEVASAIGWLCLPSSGSVTGQAIAIAGGEI
jgi:NAD(P)-dependent dehydrogenase (short-subunit alcohol dehydrogenase family)